MSYMKLVILIIAYIQASIDKIRTDKHTYIKYERIKSK